MKRKDFLKKSMFAIGGGLFLPRILQPLFGQPNFRNLREAFNNKTVIIINLSGGNDGLNTVIPYTNDIYYNLRPNISIPPTDILPISENLGFHPELSALHSAWESDNLAVIENVGYDAQNLSHFRSTDIWRSGSNSQEVISTGWIARYMEQVVADIHSNPPLDPAALQIGNSNTLQLTGESGMTGVLVDDPETFYQLVNETYDEPTEGENPVETAGSNEVDYIRQVSALSFNYADVIQEASLYGQNTVNYTNNTPGKYLKIIAKLISGGLYSPFYLVHHGGFDTHDDQLSRQETLLNRLSVSMASFMEDLANQGLDNDIIVMTSSEFGRRTYENGAFGTDHGSAAPHFILGNNINSGIFGGEPDLSNLDNNQNLHHSIDYRQIYASLMTGWFGHSQEIVQSTLSQNFESLEIF